MGAYGTNGWTPEFMFIIINCPQKTEYFICPKCSNLQVWLKPYFGDIADTKYH